MRMVGTEILLNMTKQRCRQMTTDLKRKEECRRPLF